MIQDQKDWSLNEGLRHVQDNDIENVYIALISFTNNHSNLNMVSKGKFELVWIFSHANVNLLHFRFFSTNLVLLNLDALKLAQGKVHNQYFILIVEKQTI